MRHIALLLAAVTIAPAVAAGQTTRVPTFAGIPWGAAPPEVVKAVTASGFELLKQDSDGDYQFAGQLFGVDAVVYAFISPAAGLVKVQVRLVASDDLARVKYSEVVRSMTSRYGTTEEVELYKPPYYKGDGREDEAISLGQGLLFSTWGDEERPGGAALVVRATRQVVGLDYESYDWAAEVDRRRRKAVALD